MENPVSTRATYQALLDPRKRKNEISNNIRPPTRTEPLVADMMSPGRMSSISLNRLGMAGVSAEIILVTPSAKIRAAGETRKSKLSFLVEKLPIPTNKGIQNSNKRNNKVIEAAPTMGMPYCFRIKATDNSMAPRPLNTGEAISRMTMTTYPIKAAGRDGVKPKDRIET